MEFQAMIEEKRRQFFPVRLAGGASGTGYCVDEATFREAVTDIYASVFPERDAYPYRPKSAHLVKEYAHGHVERLLIENAEGKVVGWLKGRMEDANTFYLGTSGMLPEYRAQRIAAVVYARFLEYLEDLGYERVTSQHHPHNRSAMILQLKYGFTFEGMSLDERWGPMVKMVHFFDGDRRAEFERRFGFEQYPKGPSEAAV
ncbi:GNAT family N-acetyltransferase [Streptomyces sp. DSM 41014]|uniref:GNAT family N-acetyltransferase n=1 Tax=Streptomyces hintoniae TaxID=3075521 RepID=A0ABU2UGE6_9ACTN|nr:GNAT family N-acetyltransferase [Streptomyces sp. DSM 41014]MDT0472328.1 GNAT family N-acetyltransferase [Streptomyces sp. DSM 41014]